jgi:hypothetical protein
MAQNLTCDGCLKSETEGERFTRKGYIEPVDYCPECLILFEAFDRERRNLAAESAMGYIEVARMNKENFLVEHPDFKLPDGDED